MKWIKKFPIKENIDSSIELTNSELVNLLENINDILLEYRDDCFSGDEISLERSKVKN